MEKLIEDYISLSIIQKDATEKGDYNANNKAIKKRVKLVNDFIKNGTLIHLHILLNHDDLNVRLWAALDLLSENLYYQDCINTLKLIYQVDKGVIGWGAEMTLKRLGHFEKN